MNKVVALSLALLCPSLAVAEVTLDMHMNIAGQAMETKMIFDQNAQPCFSACEGVMVEAMATPEGDNDVVVKVKVFINNEQGEAVLVAAPVIKTAFDEMSELSITDEAGVDGLKVKVVATKNEVAAQEATATLEVAVTSHDAAGVVTTEVITFQENTNEVTITSVE